MEYQGIDCAVCEAEESDWLDVSYSERKYVDKKKRHAATDKGKKGGKIWKFAVVMVVCVAVLAGLLFLDGDFKQEVFAAVKTATATIFNRTEELTQNKIDIPCNLTLVDVDEGVMTFSGGRAALALTDGKISDVSQNSVTVWIDDATSIVYSGLTTVFVSAQDSVTKDSLIGKYDGQFTASILQNGQVVKQVVGSETQLVWNV